MRLAAPRRLLADPRGTPRPVDDARGPRARSLPAKAGAPPVTDAPPGRPGRALRQVGRRCGTRKPALGDARDSRGLRQWGHLLPATARPRPPARSAAANSESEARRGTAAACGFTASTAKRESRSRALAFAPTSRTRGAPPRPRSFGGASKLWRRVKALARHDIGGGGGAETSIGLVDGGPESWVSCVCAALLPRTKRLAWRQ